MNPATGSATRASSQRRTPPGGTPSEYPPARTGFGRSFLRDLRHLLEDPAHTSTYPFALVHALADLAVEAGDRANDPVQLPVRAISSRVAEMYWPQVAPWMPDESEADEERVLVQTARRGDGSRMRAAVVRKVLEARRMHGPDLHAWRADGGMARRSGWDSLVSSVYRTLRHGPLPDLQKPAPHPFIFDGAVEGRGRRATITLRPEVARCLRTFHPRVTGLACTAWIRLVQEANPHAACAGSQLRNFLFPPPPVAAATLPEALGGLQGGRCFHCGEALGADPFADRFIPWDRFRVELAHNLIAVHLECAGKREARLLHEDALGRWTARNRSVGMELGRACTSAGVRSDRGASAAVAAWAYERAEERDEEVVTGRNVTRRLDGRWREALRGRPARTMTGPLRTAPVRRRRVAPEERPPGPWTGGRLVRRLVEERGDAFADSLRAASRGVLEGRLDWRCPPAEDPAYERLTTGAVLRQLGLELTCRGIESFWPEREPRWDAVATTPGGGLLFVDGRASVPELLSAPIGLPPASRTRLGAALDEVSDHLGVVRSMDWGSTFFGYTSRLAHLHLLRELNGIEAWVAFVRFVGDAPGTGSATEEEWRGALRTMHRALGLTPLRLPEGRIEVFLDAG